MTAAGSNTTKGRCLVYEITLKGNYNLSIDDLGIAFSPEQRVRQVSDEDYNSSASLKRYVGKYLVARQIADAKQATKSQPAPKKSADVVELKSKQTEQEPIVADGAAGRRAADDHKPINPAEQPKKVEEQVDALKADGASKVSAADKVVAAEAAKAKQAEEAAVKAQAEAKQEVKEADVKVEAKVEVKPEIKPAVKEEKKAEPKVEAKPAEKKPAAKKDAGKKPASGKKKK